MCCCPVLPLVAACLLAADATENWPDFRGSTGDGQSQEADLPLRWSETENVVWKTAIPDRGWSSPVIWGDQVWMTTATRDGRKMFAIAVNKRSGRIEHHVQVFENEETQPIDPLNSYASPSPVIESGRVYVHFGTYGTACLDTASGDVIWRRRDLKVDHQKGPGSSPVLGGDRLVLSCDGNDVQDLIALDKSNGRTVWKTARSIDLSGRSPDYRKSFSTPLVLPSNDTIVSVAAGGAYAHDARTGREQWQVRYGGHTNVSRPVSGLGMVFINTGYPVPALWGVRLGGSGDVTQTQVVWKVTQSVPIKPSILLADDRLYMVSDTGGVLTCLEARTGKTVWRERLGGNYSASPLLAGNRIYFFSQEGITTVLKRGQDYQVLATNRLDGCFMASPAVSGRSLYLRTEGHLYRIGR